MDMSGEYRIEAPRDEVWRALNDPKVLERSIPGCERLEQTGENELEADVTAKIGPVKAKFRGKVRLENIDPPKSYTIVGEGKGGAAGFAKGGADVTLEEADGATVLRYTAKADVGGKLAQIGSRLVQGAAKKTADDFFARFSEIVAGPADETTKAEEEASVEADIASAQLAMASSQAEAAPAESAAAPAATPTAQTGVEPPSADRGAGAVVWVAAGVAALVVIYLLVG